MITMAENQAELNLMMHKAVEQGDLAKLHALLEDGAEINDLKSSNVGTLQMAAAMGRAALIEGLLQRGADINLQDRFGRTAMHWAIGMNNADALALLIRKGADMTLRDGEGRTPAQYARDEGKAELALIIEKALSRHHAKAVKKAFMRRRRPGPAVA